MTAPYHELARFDPLSRMKFAEPITSAMPKATLAALVLISVNWIKPSTYHGLLGAGRMIWLVVLTAASLLSVLSPVFRTSRPPGSSASTATDEFVSAARLVHQCGEMYQSKS